MTQVQIVKKSFLKALDSGIIHKQEIYNFVAEETKTPRPTIRRIARGVRDDLQRQLDILSENIHVRNIATAYDCPSCLAVNVIKKSHKRCPKCQVLLDWD